MTDRLTVDATWLSVSDLARERGISKQAISKRLKSFGASVPTRREGRGVLVDVAIYDKACGQNTDPAQAFRNLGQTQQHQPTPPASDATVALEVYSVQRARQASFDADLTKLKLEKESGRWVEAAKAQQMWAKELVAFVAETESFIVNRLTRELAERHGLDWKEMAVAARDLFRAFRASEAARQKEIEKDLNNGSTD